MRIGIGYDIHRVARGRRLVLGGVGLRCPIGLIGHSNGDVVLHAVADAILGAAALGDLGEHFPDNDEKWRDADSADILAAVVGMAAERALRVHNADVNVVAQALHQTPGHQWPLVVGQLDAGGLGHHLLQLPELAVTECRHLECIGHLSFPWQSLG